MHVSMTNRAVAEGRKYKSRTIASQQPFSDQHATCATVQLEEALRSPCTVSYRKQVAPCLSNSAWTALLHAAGTLRLAHSTRRCAR
eukprot:6176791-Pleurochrysis_carterae.AAC.2